MSLSCNAAVRRSHVLEIDFFDNSRFAWMDCALGCTFQPGREHKGARSCLRACCIVSHTIKFFSTQTYFTNQRYIQHTIVQYGKSLDLTLRRID
jgi:hypothetical protein